jgi:hypothetical protein
MGVTAGIFLASILPKEMRYLVYINIYVNSSMAISYPYSVITGRNREGSHWQGLTMASP